MSRHRTISLRAWPKQSSSSSKNSARPCHPGSDPEHLTSEPQSGKTYGYSSENRLTSASGGVVYYYDPIGRLSEYDTPTGSRFMSDGAEVVVEVDSPAANIVRRFVRGDGPDELIAWYEGSGTTSRRFAGLDERNSVISATDSSGTLVGINAYDEYGKPASGNVGRFGYTGQLWLPEANAYYYKARAYLPHLGIFAQTDPIGFAAGMNQYAYVLNDPVNLVDTNGTRIVWNPRYACVGVGKGACGWTGFYSSEPDPPSPSTSTSNGDNGKGEGGSGAPKSPCEAALEQSGKIEYGGNTASLVFLGGLQVSWGEWRNLKTGSWGNFRTVGGGLGFGLGVTRDYGHASSLAEFVGYGETAMIGIQYGWIGGNYSRTQDAYGKWVSQGGSLNLPPFPPSALSTGKLGGTLTATAGQTTVSGCHVRGQ